MKPFKSIRCLLVMLMLLQGLCGMAQHYVPVDGMVSTVKVLPKLGGDSVYLVNSALTVVPGGDLRVEAGTKICFAELACLRVEGGRLRLEGSLSDSIYLSSYEFSHDWAGIQLRNVTSEGSVKISYVKVMGALTAVSATNCRRVKISHCMFDNYYAGKGVELLDCKSCTIDNNFFSQCISGVELKAKNGDNKDNIITNNIFYQGQINIELSNIGYVFKCDRNHISENYFEGAATAISFETASGSLNHHTINFIEDNLISSSLPSSGAGYSSCGIKAAMDSIVIRDNVFWRNDEAIRMSRACRLAIEQNTFYDNGIVFANLLASGKATFVDNTFSEVKNCIVTYPSGLSKMNGNNFLHFKKETILFANASAEAVDMRENYWDVQTVSEIDDVIMDAHDDASLGEIIYDGYLAECSTTPPVSPPFAVKKQLVDNQWLISWDENPESDVDHYVLFHGDFKYYKFSNHIDNIQGHSYVILPQQTSEVAVMACDRAYNPSVYSSVGQSAYAFAVDYPYAGKDITLCAPLTGYTIDDASFPSGFGDFVWRTSGTGCFSDTLALRPVYYPSQRDIDAGEVTLTLCVFDNGMVKTDAMKLTLFKELSVFAGNDSYGGMDRPLTLNGAEAYNYDSLRWQSLGDGIFEDPTNINTVYYPGAADKAQGYVDLVLEAWSSCGHHSSMVRFYLFKEYSLEGRTWMSGMVRPNTQVIAASLSDGNQFMSGFYRTISDAEGVFRFDALLPDTYILYAFPDTLSLDAGGCYYLGDLQWNESNMIVVDGNVYDVDIELPALATGFITGEGCIEGVFDYPQTSFRAGDFYCRPWLREGDGTYCVGGLSNVGVLLLDASKSRVLGFALTDASGGFKFAHLPFGTYHVMADLPRYGRGLCEEIVLTPESPCVSGLHLFVNQNGRVGMRKDNTTALSEMSVYPNPANDKIFMDGLTAASDYYISITNSLGMVVQTEHVVTDVLGMFTLSMADLPVGVYCVRAENQRETRMVKVVKM